MISVKKGNNECSFYIMESNVMDMLIFINVLGFILYLGIDYSPLRAQVMAVPSSSFSFLVASKGDSMAKHHHGTER